MLAVDRSIVTALVVGRESLQKADQLLAGAPDRRMFKSCMFALSFELMNAHGMEIMRTVGRILVDRKITLVPDDPKILARGNELLAIVGSPQPHWSGWTIDICDCISWAMAEIGGGKLATLNVALREYTQDILADAHHSKRLPD